MASLTDEGGLHLLGLLLALIDGRDSLIHVKRMSGEDCIAAHSICFEMDGLLKAQWRLMGSPVAEDEESVA